MSKEVRPLSRLCGLETEYALHFDRSADPEGTHRTIFDLLLEHVAEQIPVAPPQEDKAGGYLANGCAVWFEASVPGAPEGLVEVATPECHGPTELVAASRGVDRLLAESTESIQREDVKLLKNCIDTEGHCYGAQENYEVDAYDASEVDVWSRKIERLKWIEYACLTAFFVIPLLLLELLWELRHVPITAVSLIVLTAIVIRTPVYRRFVFMWYLRLVLIPKTIAVSLFYRSSKMGRTYKTLAPFLVSRVIYAGAGGLDRRGRFYLGQKAYSRSVDWFLACVDYQRSIFCINQVYKDLVRGIVDGTDHSLYKCRQRMSLSIGDSNMCQESEYLRVATTILVLDAIESGVITDSDVPHLKGTITGLRKFNWDPTLREKAKTTQGSMTALEIQRLYLSLCRRYIDSLDQPSKEASEILQRWEDVLDRLQHDQESLFGRIDWITKRAMMRHVAKSDSDAAEWGTNREFAGVKTLARLRKIDTKYHQVNQDGYYYRLFDQALTQPLLADGVVERAGRMPPLSNPAAQRCRYIREFTDEIEWVRWDAIKLKDNENEIRFERDG